MLRVTVTALMVVIVAAVGAAPAESRCVAANVFVHWSGGADQPVVTEGQCLVPTSFTAYYWQEANVNVPTVPGVPSGAYLEVWVPLP
jgi:hypothetical protein